MATRCGPLAGGLAAVPADGGAPRVVVVAGRSADAMVPAGPEIVVSVVAGWPVAGLSRDAPVVVGAAGAAAGWRGAVGVVVARPSTPGAAAWVLPAAATRRTGGAGRPLRPTAARATARRT